MIGNAPGLFSIVQGVKAQARAAAAPSAFPMPNIPGVMGGGPINVAGYDGGITADQWTTSAPGSTPQDAPPQAVPDNFYINQLIGQGDIQDFESAQAMWNDMSPEMQARWRASIDATINKNIPGAGGGSDAATYAGIAERANEAAQQLAFNREQEAHKMAEARQAVAAQQDKALQDFYMNREALKNARAQIQTDRATSALNAWSQNVGHANVPGIGNYSLAGGQGAENMVAGNRPILNFNPLEAMGAAPSWEEGPTPNIPGIDYGQAA